MGRERLAAFESTPSCGLGYFGRVEYMLVSIPPSTFLDEVHHATPGSSFDETGNFDCTSGDRIDRWDFDASDRFAPTEPERLGGGVCYRDVGPLGLSSQAAKQPSRVVIPIAVNDLAIDCTVTARRWRLSANVMSARWAQAAIESCYSHRGQRFGCRLYGHCPTLALVG
jgi:hypothetical protein